MAITSSMILQYQHPRVKLVVGGTTIYEDDFVSGSFSYRGGTSGGGAFAPGGCVISSVSFSLYNRDGSYSNLFSDGTQVQVYIGYGATAQTATYDLLCTVYCADVTKRNYKVSIKAYDKLRDADKKKWTTYSFPMTVSQIISSAASEAGISVDTLPTYGASISVDLRDDDGNQPELNMTCRQAIAQALLISGNYGYMTASGSLYCGWYNSTADATIDTAWLMDYSISDSRSYSGVQVYGQSPTGSTDRLYVLSSGAFITEDNCADIQSRLYTALVGTPCYSAQIVAVCNPNITAGMMVQLTMPHAGGSQTVTLPITSVGIRGSMKATYSSETISTDEADDLRDKGEETTEDVSRGDYATKKYVDDAIAGGGGGGSGTMLGLYLKPLIVTMSASQNALRLNASGLTRFDTGLTGFNIAGHYITVPTYEAYVASGNQDFVVPLECSLGTTYFGVANVRAKYSDDHTLYFFSNYDSYGTWFSQARVGSTAIFWVRVFMHSTRGYATYDLNTNAWT